MLELRQKRLAGRVREQRRLGLQHNTRWRFFEKAAGSKAGAGAGGYGLISRGASVGPLTVTDFCAVFTFSCQVLTVYEPSGKSGIT